MNMRVNFVIFSFFVIMAMTSLGCIESQRAPIDNLTPSAVETTIFTSEPKISITEQIPVYNETIPVSKINITFETWSRGYWSNNPQSLREPYFRVITNYSQWIAFLNYEGYNNGYLEGSIFPGVTNKSKTIKPDNFNNNIIIAAMMGLRAYAEAPEIEIKNISRVKDVINVTIRLYKPSFGAAEESNPYHVVIVKRDLLPRGNSTFVFISTEGKELGKLMLKV